jgi:hypothetical protein
MNWQKVFHHHIRKCGGTAINAWLDTLVHSERAREPTFMRQHGIRMGDPRLGREQRQSDTFRHAALRSLSWFDVLHDHIDLGDLIGPDVYVFTVLRDPVDRVLSQYRDFKRLQPSDYAGKSDDAVQVHEACRTMSFAGVYETCWDGTYFKFTFEDMQARSLTQSTIDFDDFQRMEPEARAEAAYAVVKKRVMRTGLQSQSDMLLRGIARDLGWVPPQTIPRRNVTDTPKQIPAEDAAAAHALTRADKILFDRLRPEIEAMQETDAAYTESVFEREFASASVRDLSPVMIGRENTFDMNMPIIGYGFHGRDAARTTECCSWIGPRGDALLYFPVPGPGLDIKVRLYVKGWVSEALRETTAVYAYDEAVRVTSEPRAGCAEALVFNVRTRRDWVKLRIRSSRVMTDAEAGRDGGDSRPKLFNLWRYSYEA